MKRKLRLASMKARLGLRQILTTLRTTAAILLVYWRHYNIDFNKKGLQ
jgi:hypothetical protein